MEGPSLRVNRDLSIPLDEVTVRTSRSGGPGGQHANVTASRVEASFDVAASRALTEEQRARLMARCGPRRATKPGRAARQRRLDSKRRRSETKRGRRRPDVSD